MIIPHQKRSHLFNINTPKQISGATKILPAASAVALFIQATTTTHAAPAEFQNKEEFSYDRLGPVIVRSSNQASLRPGHVSYNAQVEIVSRKNIYPGVLHNSMGGNDRTFTRHASDNFLRVDGTTASNPVMMRILMGPYFYSKRREQITIALLREAYTCIPR